ncbi:MAG: haloacid dehalogenase type II [Actinobacteria bacterium]|nr:haloacid dehalogenase type II [Actinomycetota bacterium]
MPRAILFDVNETLLDMAALDPLFEGLFGDRSARAQWFDRMLQSALVSTVTARYSEFGVTGLAALEMLATQRGVELSDGHRSELRETMRHLPPHPEVRTSLERLRDAGLRLATLTNSTPEVAEAQLINSGLRDLFEASLSAHGVRRLKPAPEPYRMAADALGIRVDEARLVAAHSWDIAGALNAGLEAAFVARPGKVLDPLVDAPGIVGADLDDVATKIMEAEL